MIVGAEQIYETNATMDTSNDIFKDGQLATVEAVASRDSCKVNEDSYEEYAIIFEARTNRALFRTQVTSVLS